MREQHELTQEIGNAITSMPITEPIDEEELDTELQAMEQEKLDEKMLNTGTLPVNDSLNRMPAAADGPRMFFPFLLSPFPFSPFSFFHFFTFSPCTCKILASSLRERGRRLYANSYESFP